MAIRPDTCLSKVFPAISLPVFKLALIQIRGRAKSRNLARAERFIAEAAAAGARAVLLPETLNTGWTHRSAHTEADPIPAGESWLAADPRRHRVFICGGLVERAGNRLYNSAVLIDPRSEIILHHRKLNELDLAHDLYAQGDRLAVAETELGTFGVIVRRCLRAGTNRTLGLMGADIILSPCAWAMPADHDNVREPYGQLWLDNYQPVARDFRVWIAGCSNVGWIDDGPWRGRQCIGCSLVIDPRGDVAARGPYGVEAETMILLDIEPERRPARGDGWSRQSAIKTANHE